MNLTLSKRVLRFLSPKQEEERREFRMALSKTMANAEDVTRTVRIMNGHLSEHIAQWKKK
jgi:hypothetical protein